jgi:outer membrane protein TolC
MKRKVSLIIVLMLLTTFTVGVYAEEVKDTASEDTLSLSIEEAVDLAMENSLDVSTAEMNYEIAKLDTLDKKDDYNDDYTVSFSDNKSLEDQIKTLMTSKGYNYKLALTTETYSEKAIEYIGYDVESEIIDLYYDILYAREDIKIKKTSQLRAQGNYDDTYEEYEFGRASKNELDTAQYSLDKATVDLENSRFDYENYVTEFNIELGVDIYLDVALTSSLEYENFASTLGVDEMVSNSLNKSSSYQSALFHRDYYSQYCSLLGNALTATNFGKEAYANLIIAENNLKQIENQMQLSVVKTLNTFKQLENNIEMSNRNIEEIEKCIQQQELKYEMGLCTFDEVLEQYDTLDSAELTLLGLTKTYCTTAAQFNKSIE